MKKNPLRTSRPVAVWVYIGLVMLLVQVILGGVTRLTGSGLSITEWNIVTGAIPPLGEAQWVNEFEKYKQTPQYFLLNTEFTLQDFKFIFFWEWMHRFWARLIAVVFLVPFIMFLVQKRFRPEMVRPLIILFLLGALQGAVGWIMVASGLTGDAVYVKPTRLALHFVFALGLICYTFWFALQLSVPKHEKVNSRPVWNWTWIILVLLFFQLIYGALMAGHKAAASAPTWPTINGSLVPDNMLRYLPATVNLIENKITIHFIHRGFAYLLLAFTIIWTVKALRVQHPGSLFKKSRWLPLALVGAQVLLGIATVLTSTSILPDNWGVFEWMAQLHQVVALLYLLAMVWMLYLARGRRLSGISNQLSAKKKAVV